MGHFGVCVCGGGAGMILALNGVCFNGHSRAGVSEGHRGNSGTQ